MRTPSRFTFTKVGHPEFPDYEVRERGVLLGKVWRAWFRLGGHSWTHSLVAGIGYATREEAARYLAKAYAARAAKSTP